MFKKMKVLIAACLLALVGYLYYSCDNDVENKIDKLDKKIDGLLTELEVKTVEAENNKVAFSIPLKQQTSARSLTALKNDANYYEVIFRQHTAKNGEYIESSFISYGDNIEGVLNKARYDILILAGVKNDDFPPILVGSGLTSSIDILSGNNEITLTLFSTDYSLALENSNDVLKGNPFFVLYEYKLRNASILISTENVYFIDSENNILNKTSKDSEKYRFISDVPAELTLKAKIKIKVFSVEREWFLIDTDNAYCSFNITKKIINELPSSYSINIEYGNE
jgi:hypothetical protein